MSEVSELTPGIRFPPPFLFAAGFGAGLVLQRTVPVQLMHDGPHTFANLAQWALFVTGAAVALWGIFTFFRARTAIIPHRPASKLVANGPFQYSRNPMYVGLTLMYLGLAVWVNSLWPFLMLPLSHWALWTLVVKKEERYLQLAYGEEYAAYCRRVRRWI